MENQKKFKVATLGCRTNQYESQAYIDQLRNMGWVEAKEGEPSDLCIVNTCTVTQSADSHSRHQIRQFGRDNPGAKLVITGCLAERAPDEIGTIEGVTSVIANRDKENLLQIVFPEEEIPEFAIENFDGRTRAFVKVQDGCNSFCTYCIIPYVRGRSRSRSVPDILKEVEQLVANGYKEVVLTGINIGDFDGGGGVRLSQLIRAVDKIPGLERIRVSSIDPDEVDDDLADAILNGKKTCPSMHIVLQAGSNTILKRMNRKYTRQVFLETVYRLVKAHPDFTVTTDVIVGFPGETEEDFQETLQVIQEVQFAKVHLFPYSERKRTRAAIFPHKLTPQIIAERKQIAIRKAEQAAFNLRSRFVGRRLKVLLEEDGKFGHTDNFLPVFLKEGEGKANEIIEVNLTENTPEGLCGLK